MLKDHSVEVSSGDDLTKLCIEALTSVALAATAAATTSADGKAVKKMLRSLFTVVRSTSELRDQFGSSHGQLVPSPALARHGRLAFKAYVAVAEFVSETWSARRRI